MAGAALGVNGAARPAAQRSRAFARARAAPGRLGRAALAGLAALACSCGLVHKDVTVAQEFTVGGGAPSDASFDSSSILAPLSASEGDLAHLSGVTLRAAALDATDAGGDLSFVAGVAIRIAASGLPTVTLATLPAPTSAAHAELAADATKDLKPYLAAGALLTAKMSYLQRPVDARGLKLTLTVRGSL